MKTANKAANAAYENAHIAAQDLTQRIEGLLFDLPAPDSEDRPVNWGHVAEMNEINKRLASVVAFLECTEE